LWHIAVDQIRLKSIINKVMQNMTYLPCHAKRSCPALLTVAPYRWRCQRNRRWLLTTDSDRRTLFTTVGDNTCGETTVVLYWTTAVSARRQVTQESALTFEHILLVILRGGRGGTSEGGSKRGNSISGVNFLSLFYSKHGSILLSFRDMSTGRTTNGQTTHGNIPKGTPLVAAWRRMHLGHKRNRDFRPISRFSAKLIQHRAIVTMERQQKLDR